MNPISLLIKDANKGFFKVPKTVQEAIPVVRIYDDGIFEHDNREFSMSFVFSDINYSLASEGEKEHIFDEYAAFINSVGEDCKCKITINNRKLNVKELQEKVCLPLRGDELDQYVAEYNQMIVETAVSRTSYVQEKYITITIKRSNIEEARTAFKRYIDDFAIRLSSIRSNCRILSTEERLAILHNFYREEDAGTFNYLDVYQRAMGDSFRDYICPDYMDLTNDSYIRLSDNKFVRVLFIKQFAKQIKDEVISKITSLNREMMLSIDFQSIDSEVAEKYIENIILGVETTITRWQESQNKRYNFSAIVPASMKREQEESRAFLHELTENDQKMHEAIITIAITAPTVEQLEKDTAEIKALAGNNQVSTLRWEQLDGLNTVLPIGTLRQDKFRTLITDSLAIFMPFRVNNIMHNDGVFFGQNAETGNLILVSKKSLNNGNSVILGKSGTGKSFQSKLEILSYILGTDADIIVVDPEREYSKMLNQFGGQTVYLSPSSNTFINAFEVNANYGDIDGGRDIISLKSQFVNSICEQCMAGMQFTLLHRSIVDRCTRNVLTPYIMNGYQGEEPTLVDFYEELLKQDEPEAKQLAMSMEIFVKGSFNLFAHKGNVNVDSRIMVYDLNALDNTLKPLAMLIMMDNILNRISKNRSNKKNTYIIIDEAWLLYKYKFTAETVEELYRRVRKYGAFITSISQNLSDMIHNESALSMLKNSELVVMLNQDDDDRKTLAQMYQIPRKQLMFITNAPKGSGLMKIGDTVIPFANNFPKNTELYRMMSTNINENYDDDVTVEVNTTGLL